MGFNGQRMKTRREQLGLKRRELGSILEVDSGDIGRYERGATRPNDTRLAATRRRPILRQRSPAPYGLARVGTAAITHTGVAKGATMPYHGCCDTANS